jgi:transcriptional regulator with XRE-family HTH domain
MGSHAKPRRYTSSSERSSIVSEYTAGSTQVELAAKYNLTQVAISKILRREPRTLRLSTSTRRRLCTFLGYQLAKLVRLLASLLRCFSGIFVGEG